MHSIRSKNVTGKARLLSHRKEFLGHYIDEISDMLEVKNQDLFVKAIAHKVYGKQLANFYLNIKKGSDMKRFPKDLFTITTGKKHTFIE